MPSGQLRHTTAALFHGPVKKMIGGITVSSLPSGLTPHPSPTSLTILSLCCTMFFLRAACMPVVRNLAAKLYIARYPNPVICRHNEQHVPNGTECLTEAYISTVPRTTKSVVNLISAYIHPAPPTSQTGTGWVQHSTLSKLQKQANKFTHPFFKTCSQGVLVVLC